VGSVGKNGGEIDEAGPAGRGDGEESAAAVAQVGFAAMRTAIGLTPSASDFKNCQGIYRFEANPGKPRGGVLPPTPVLAPGTALRSRPRVALSSAQVPRGYSEPRPLGKSQWDRPGANRGGTMPRELQGQRRLEYQDPHREGESRRADVRANVFYCHASTTLYLYL
jgi:hypothetical protein